MADEPFGDVPGHDDGWFGESVASHYDDVPEPMVDGTPVADAVRVLAALARRG